MAEPTRFLRTVAAAIADGERIDWTTVDRKAIASDRCRAAALQVIERVASRVSNAQSLDRSIAASRTVAPQGALMRADAMILTIAVLQAFTALVFPESWSGISHPLPSQFARLATGTFLICGVTLLLAGRGDRRALHLGGVFLCAASTMALRLLPAAAPLPLLAETAQGARHVLPEALLPFYLWRFVREFPRVVRFEAQSRVAETAIRASAAVGLALCAGNILAAALSSNHLLPGLLRPLTRSPGGLYWLLIGTLALPAPFFAWSRAASAPASERQRLRWFTAAVALGVSPMMLAVLAEVISPTFARWVDQPDVRRLSGMVLFAALITIPISTSYAVLAHRLFNVRLVIHRALAFALARWSVLALAIVPSAAVVVLLNAYRVLSVGEALVKPRVLVCFVAAAIGWLLYAVRQPLLRRLEARLVGIREEATGSLTALTRKLRHLTRAEELPRLLADTLRSLVGAERADIMLLSGDGTVQVDVDGAKRLASTSGLVRVVAAVSSPMRVDPMDPRSVFSWLVEEDRLWVLESGASVIAPLSETDGVAFGLLVLGPTIGGSAYSEADLKAVAAVASTTGLALKTLQSPHPAVAAVAVRPAGQCHGCGRVTPEAIGTCACGGELTPAAVPYELSGKFRLEGVLGRGGMGVVYHATDLALGRAVALKTLPRLSEKALSRLQREARSMAGFIHPHLALIFGMEAWQGVPILVVEYLPGGSLAARLPTRLTPTSALSLGAQLTGALEELHKGGLLHRDIKPHNIAFAANGSPKLLDFGLAHLAATPDGEDSEAARPLLDDLAASLERLTQSGTVVGTPLYLSPEVLAGEPSSSAQDLWSLHLVLWEAMAGRHPLADFPMSVALRRLQKAELPFSDLRALALPVAVQELLKAGLHRDPSKRPRNATAMKAAIVEAATRIT